MCARLTSIRKRKLMDWVVVNSEPSRRKSCERYRAQGAEPVVADVAELQRLGLRCVFGNLLEVHGVVRHDAGSWRRLLLEEFVRTQETTRGQWNASPADRQSAGLLRSIAGTTFACAPRIASYTWRPLSTASGRTVTGSCEAAAACTVATL